MAQWIKCGMGLREFLDSGAAQPGTRIRVDSVNYAPVPKDNILWIGDINTQGCICDCCHLRECTIIEYAAPPEDQA